MLRFCCATPRLSATVRDSAPLAGVAGAATPRPLGPSASGHCLGKHHEFRENFYKMFACYSRNTNTQNPVNFFIIFRVTVDTQETLK